MTDTSQAVPTFGSPPTPVQDVVDDNGNTYCQVHPDRETGLRCNQCTRLMCAGCAVSTPVGYRCQQCVRQREDIFFNADAIYYAKLFGVCAGLGVLGAFVANLVGWWLIVILIAMAGGSITSEAALRVTRGQRGRYAAQAAAAGVVVGAVIMMLLTALPYISYVQGQSISPEQIQDLTATYGEERAQALVQQVQQQQSGIILRVLQASLLNLSVWIYAGLTAATVYGRFNIYGRRKR